MKQWLPILLALLYGAYYVITAVLQAQARRKQQERAREAAQTRTDAASRSGSEVIAQPESQSIRQGQPVDDLAARRKAQLEQLRARRDIRAAPQPAQVRIGTPAPGGPAGAPFPIQVERVPVDRKRQEEQAVRRRRELEFQRQRQAKAARQREAQARARKQAARTSPPIETGARPVPVGQPTARAVAESAVRAVLSVGASSARADSFRRRLNDRAFLRDAIILNEIISPPKSLRTDDAIG